MLKQKAKSVGVRTQVCLTLLVTGSSSPSLPLTKIHAIVKASDYFYHFGMDSSSGKYFPQSLA